MGSKTCMNVLCGDSGSADWKKGWPLRSGEYAILCVKCGYAYEQSIFCDMFHSKDSGWRDCTSCGKRLHCGCIASQFLLELLDSGGVKCKSCVRSSGLDQMTSDEKPNEYDMLNGSLGEPEPGHVDKHLNGNGVKLNFMHLGSNIENSPLGHSLHSHHDDSNGSVVQMKQEGVLASLGEITNSCFQVSGKASNGAAQFPKLESLKSNFVGNDVDDSLVRTNLSISLGTPIGNSSSFSGVLVNEREHSKTSSLSLPGPKSRHLLPKPPKSMLSSSLEANRGIVSQIRVARPPAEGRGRNQLLPRYWPRITDQELQQISGDCYPVPAIKALKELDVFKVCQEFVIYRTISNSTIVPLFEKVLSASDAGRIGRLVLPKACAEAYFPPISQPEGLPLRIQDVKGREWVFQFRFWPNNNSRMYVLEGVTPCIQSMQLQAGDTVTFSRMDPEGKLVMGFRKASASVAMQESQLSAISNGSHSHSPEGFFSGSFENLPIISGYSSLLQSLKGNSDPNLNALSRHFNTTASDMSWQNPEKHDVRPKEVLLPPGMVPERKRARNIGLSTKRLLIDSQEALELKLTWEEAQDLLRPPMSVKPSIFMIEDHAFEEYDEPPVFGKRSIFVVRSSGVQEQWAQCDSCGKWRKLPVDTLLPPKWTCTDNSWDQSRCSCSAPDELAPRELENLLRLNKEFKKQKIAAGLRPVPDHESSGLDALANAAIIGDTVGDGGTASVAATTKHPRHRPGCSCIVCIQPPSGKGKHKPTCNCNVCMTVKRRFKTLMMRKKKRQSEREAEIALRNRKMWGPSKDETEVESSSRLSENEAKNLDGSGSQSPINNNSSETGKGQIDLNCQPQREEDMRVGSGRVSMMSLLQVATQPLEAYLKQNGLTSLAVSEPQTSPSCNLQPSASAEGEDQLQEDVGVTTEVQEKVSEKEDGMDEEENGPDHSQTDPH